MQDARLCQLWHGFCLPLLRRSCSQEGAHGGCSRPSCNKAAPGTIDATSTWGFAVENAVTKEELYKVVVNHEEQYSIWPVDRDNPPGWSDVGVSGTKDMCLEHIKTVWTDMRPLSLRKKMAEAQS